MAAQPCCPWWLPHLLTAAVVTPALSAIGGMVYSVQFTDDWSNPTAAQDAPGFALCGMFGIASVSVLIVWFAIRAFVARESEHYRAIAIGCGLGAIMATISLAEAMGIGSAPPQPGQVPELMLAAVMVGWVYFVIVGIGYWYLARVCRPIA